MAPTRLILRPILQNVRDKILRFRNHPSIAVWCARNEGYPPKQIDDQLRTLMAELETHASLPAELYRRPRRQLSWPVSLARFRETSTPYNEAFKTEVGSVSVPTIESIQGMMPQKDWEVINDDWAEHDLARGAQGGDMYPKILADRYGKLINLADFHAQGAARKTTRPFAQCMKAATRSSSTQ